MHTLLALLLTTLVACSDHTNAPAVSPVSAPTTRGPMTCDLSAPLACRVDADCACGSSLKDGACAFGTAACIDTDRPCPDFCSGIDGKLTVVCQKGQCAQVHS